MFQSKRTLCRQAQVLIVDDHRDNLELLSAICKLQGYETIQSDCGQIAVELARKNTPDLILLDISMPEMDGFSVCQVLKSDRLTQNIPIIFISALKEIEDKTQAFKLGGNDYITKPFQVEDVVARIEVQLKFSNLHTELVDRNQQLDRERQERQAAEVRLLQLNQRLSRLTTLDELTAIANRHYFDEMLTKEWHRAQTEHFPLGLILCDIDYFKLYNDAFGDRVGDLCLQQVAQSICQTIERTGNLAARYCGDAFAVILSPTTAKDALNMAEEICQQIRNLHILHPDSLVSDRITVSVGVTFVVPSSKHTKNELLSSTNNALNQARARGNNCAVFKPIT